MGAASASGGAGGSETATEGPGGASGGASAVGGNAATGGGAGGTLDPACELAGVPICKQGCGVCTPCTDLQQCGVVDLTCMATFTNGGSLGPSICRVDSALDHLASCDTCLEGDACVLQAPDPPSLACVPGDFCKEVTMTGTAACTFSDKTPFSLAPIPEPTVCPALSLSSTKLCGGACGGCAAGLTCSGRSPTRPFGLCLPFSPLFKKAPTVDVCAAMTCYDQTASCFYYANALSDPTAVKEYGLCFPTQDCQVLAQSLPGGGVCVDKQGTVLAGSW